jgi:hypothetical protein
MELVIRMSQVQAIYCGLCGEDEVMMLTPFRQVDQFVMRSIFVLDQQDFGFSSAHQSFLRSFSAAAWASDSDA